MSPKDENSVAPLYGIDNVTGLPTPVQMDPVTGRVLIEIYVVSDAGGVLSNGWAAKDGNSVSTLLGEADDGSGLLIPVFDNRNDFIYLDLIQE